MRKKIIPFSDHELLKHFIVLFSKPIGLNDIHQLTRNQYSHNSVLSMQNDWNLFVEFCIQRQVSPLPASVTAMRLFLQQQQPLRKYATIKRIVMTISVVHKFLSFKDVTAHQQIQLILKEMRLAPTAHSNQASALTIEQLNSLNTHWLNNNNPKEIRDLAIINLMFECALKRSELQSLNVSQVMMNNDKVQLQLADSHYQLSKNSATSIIYWLKLLGVESTGPLFRRIDKHGNIGHARLDVSSIYRLMRSASDALGLSSPLSSQSARVGAAKELRKQGHNLKSITQYGRWLSPAMPAQYIGNTHLSDNERLKFKRFKPWEQ